MDFTGGAIFIPFLWSLSKLLIKAATPARVTLSQVFITCITLNKSFIVEADFFF